MMDAIKSVVAQVSARASLSKEAQARRRAELESKRLSSGLVLAADAELVGAVACVSTLVGTIALFAFVPGLIDSVRASNWVGAMGAGVSLGLYVGLCVYLAVFVRRRWMELRASAIPTDSDGRPVALCDEQPADRS